MTHVFENSSEVTALSAGNRSEWLENTFIFNDFEDIIRLARKMHGYEAKTSLYSLDNIYYLHVVYDTELMDNSRKTNML